MNHKIGQFIELKPGVKHELLNYLGEFRRNADGQRIFRLPNSLLREDGRDHVYYEVWEALNLNTGILEKKKIPVYVNVDTPDNFVDSDRKNVIDDSNEVTSLLDSYDCWYSGDRSNYNFHLNAANIRHTNQIIRLRELDSQNLTKVLALGVRYKLIMKETPNQAARRNYREWQKTYPEFANEIKNYVYQTSNFNNVSSSEGLQS